MSVVFWFNKLSHDWEVWAPEKQYLIKGNFGNKADAQKWAYLAGYTLEDM